MTNTERYIEEQSKILIDLIGEEKAKKYMQKDYFSPTAIGLAIFFAKTKIFTKENPVKFLVILILVIAILFYILYDNFFY